MDEIKYQQLLNTKKFERISFAADYITQIKKMQGDVSIEDFGSCMSKLYDSAKLDGQIEILEKQSQSTLEELKKLYEM